ncbi:MAG TPA: thiamine phosphate synthase [Acidobacteriota bacterium]|nr:thiamine phosphate synthase [Acidobacteriota bacterium]
MTKLPSRPFIYPLTDRILAGSLPIGEIIEGLCSGGARLIQLREKDVTTREFLEIALEAVQAARKRGARLLINDRVDIACLADADGVHLGDEDLPAADARRLLGPKAIIGISCHSLDDVEAAAGEPVDYIAVGPVFPTETKVLRFPVVGTELVRKARRLTGLPLVAIGGIRRENAVEVIAAGADGLAVISELMVAGEIERRTRELVAAIHRD